MMMPSRFFLSSSGVPRAIFIDKRDENDVNRIINYYPVFRLIGFLFRCAESIPSDHLGRTGLRRTNKRLNKSSSYIFSLRCVYTDTHTHRMSPSSRCYVELSKLAKFGLDSSSIVLKVSSNINERIVGK